MTRWLLAAAVAFAFLYPFPYFEALRSANEVPRILLTREIVEHGTFRLDAAAGDLGSTFDVATTPDGHKFSNKAPGPSFLAVPAYLALKATVGRPTMRQMTWAFRLTAATLPMLLFLWWFWRSTPQRGAFLALAFGSMAYPYGILFYSHAPAMAAAGGAFLAATAAVRGSARAPAVAGLLAAAAVVCDYQAILAAAAIAVYLVARAPRRGRAALLFLLGAAAPAALLLSYHHAAFGSPFRTGYAFAADPAQKQGFLGIVGPNAAALYQAFVAPSNGLLVLTPWVLLAFVGAVKARHLPETWTCAAVALLYFAFIGSTVPEFGRGGWSVGPRYITVAIPFLAWLAAPALDAAEPRPAWRVAAHALVLVGVAVHVVAATTYPHWPVSFQNPLYEVSFRLLGEGRAPHSLGTLVGLRGIASLAPLYAVVAAVAAGLLGLRRSTLAAALVAAGIIAGYSFFPRGTPPDKIQFIEREWEP
ncbi:MAG TPA: hypothetical protein VKE22_10195 [Haliangiales bacterium]|nr:hypothetical protein [Haliangiales bacterium]